MIRKKEDKIEEQICRSTKPAIIHKQ
ncbi:hypothetical protein ACJIZ3_005890 [Penstemon smallii]|uniref:Uncharacterized protein n=1 Tax=Penstemon smallii TaxID=265156 RepID=A0ABD3S6E8_9LAMI